MILEVATWINYPIILENHSSRFGKVKFKILTFIFVQLDHYTTHIGKTRKLFPKTGFIHFLLDNLILPVPTVGALLLFPWYRSAATFNDKTARGRINYIKKWNKLHKKPWKTEISEHFLGEFSRICQ